MHHKTATHASRSCHLPVENGKCTRGTPVTCRFHMLIKQQRQSLVKVTYHWEFAFDTKQVPNYQDVKVHSHIYVCVKGK